MNYNLIQKRILPFLLVILAALCFPNTVHAVSSKGDKDPKEILQKWVATAREQYDNLPDQGKFATGAVVGFTTSKLAVRSAVKFVKVAGAAFVATEVLDAAGILDLEAIGESESSESMKRKAIGKVGELRNFVKSRFDGKNIKRWMDKDKMGSLGAAAGAFVGFLS